MRRNPAPWRMQPGWPGKGQGTQGLSLSLKSRHPGTPRPSPTLAPTCRPGITPLASRPSPGMRPPYYTHLDSNSHPGLSWGWGGRKGGHALPQPSWGRDGLLQTPSPAHGKGARAGEEQSGLGAADVGPSPPKSWMTQTSPRPPLISVSSSDSGQGAGGEQLRGPWACSCAVHMA